MPTPADLGSLRRLKAWIIAVASAAVACTIGWVVVPSSASVYFGIAFCCLWFVFMRLQFRWFKASRATQGREFTLCPHCGYDTTGIAPSDPKSEEVRCPECGNHATRTEMAKAWRKETQRL